MDEDYYEEGLNDTEAVYHFELVAVPESYVVYTVADYDYNLNELFADRYADLVEIRDRCNLFAQGSFMATFYEKYIGEAAHIAEEAIYRKGSLEVFMPILKGKKANLSCVKKNMVVF